MRIWAVKHNMATFSELSLAVRWQGCLRTVETFRIVRYIVGVRC